MEKILNGRRHKDARADNAEYDAMLLEMEQLLLQAGYYRARIASLSPFDKLTGGLAWCIAACTTQVDIDLTYDDDATLGDKMALRRMECPHELQAHQIQGLDYPSLLPLLRWLCRRVLSMRHHHGRQMRMHALHHLRSTSSCFPTTPAASHQGLEGLHCSSPFSSSSSSSSIRAGIGREEKAKTYIIVYGREKKNLNHRPPTFPPDFSPALCRLPPKGHLLIYIPRLRLPGGPFGQGLAQRALRDPWGSLIPPTI
eukprot:jgi/Mesen1/8717/ME000052S08150